VLIEKYEFTEKNANAMSEFLVPMLDFVPEKRPTAAQLLQHPWLNVGPLRQQPKTLPALQLMVFQRNKGKRMRKETQWPQSWGTLP
jgi:serine/threonine protein kinase